MSFYFNILWKYCNHKSDKCVNINLNFKRGKPHLLNIEPVIHKLPARVENFVGRNIECKTVIENINNWRYLSIEGPQGIGKSAIVKQVANMLYDRNIQVIFYFNYPIYLDVYWWNTIHDNKRLKYNWKSI